MKQKQLKFSHPKNESVCTSHKMNLSILEIIENFTRFINKVDSHLTITPSEGLRCEALINI